MLYVAAYAFQGCQVGILRPNSRNLLFFIVVWHEKMVLGMCVIVGVFWPFYGVGMKTLFGIFLKPLARCCWRFGIIELFLRTKVLSFLLFSTIQAAQSYK